MAIPNLMSVNSASRNLHFRTSSGATARSSTKKQNALMLYLLTTRELPIPSAM